MSKLDKKHKMVKGIDAHYRYNPKYCPKPSRLRDLINFIKSIFTY